MARSRDVRQMLVMLDRAYSRRSWHGPNLRGSLRGVTARQAARRPGRGRHNIWEIAVHAAYWKYVVWRRITGATRGSFPLEGSNWFTRPVDATERAWRADLALLDRMHRQLRKAVDEEGVRGATRDFLLTGIVAHDVYHAGQIQLIKRMLAGR
jgi:uncharacterized damage-inducible protein DinB